MSAQHDQAESAVITLENVQLYYPRSRSLYRSAQHNVLDDINLTIHSGQTIGIVGRNGAGKSSLLKILAGVLSPDSGRVVKQNPNLRVSLLTLQLGFQQHLTGRENALLGCLLTGLSRSQAEAVLPEIIEFSGLGNVIDDSIVSYSSGMRARLGFSVAYFTQSDVVLIDEILGVGDHEFKIKSREAICSAIHSDRTVVLVSHDEQLLGDLCDSLIWIENGRTVMQDLPHKVLETYHDYDHAVRELSRSLNITTEDVRAHPNNADPVLRLNKLRQGIKRERQSQISTPILDATSSVSHYFPGHRENLSCLLREECGQTVWIENTRQMYRGTDHEARTLYMQHEDMLATLARLAKIENRDVRRTAVSQQLIETLYLFGKMHGPRRNN